MTRFLLIRHALTDSVGKRLSGRMEGVPLNAAGQAQAQQLADRLSGLPLAAIYCSPLERAQATAAPLARALDLDCQPCDDFLEIAFGEWTNSSFEDLAHQPPFQRFNSFRSGTRIPGGESMAEAQLRLVNGLEKLRARHPQQTVAVVSHADLIKAGVAYFAGIPLDLFQRLEISPASVSVIGIDDYTARILLLNDTGSLAF
jgi:probable phosphomutase (TIGR03848 family)